MKFFKNVKKEMKKVVWPNKKYMIKNTVVTVLLVVFCALYFFGINLVAALVKGLR